MHAQSARLVSLVRALGLVVGVTPAFAQFPLNPQPPPKDLWKPSYATQHSDRKACDESRYSLEVPVSAPAFAADFEWRFTASLGLSPVWFGCPTCSPSDYRARITQVLPNLSSMTQHPLVPTIRRDGHRRGFVVDFQQRKGTSWVPVKPAPDQGCAIVSAMRKAAAVGQRIVVPSSHSPQPAVLVSRVCAMVAQDAEGWMSAGTAEWADQRIDAVPNAFLPQVEVALIDTGVPPAHRAALGIVGNSELPAFEGTSTTYHPHGAHMAALIRSVAPNARLRSYRALDEAGMGSVSALARSLDDALFAAPWTQTQRPPLVVNMSVGAPPDFFLPTQLKDGSCETWEDGSGEVLRYTLHVAANLEGATQTPVPVFIVASAGNAPLEFSTGSETPWADGPPASRCGTGNLVAATSSFFPAAFAEARSCMTTTASRWLTVQPVGASTYRDGRSVLTKLGGLPHLFAPGERVYARNAALPPAQTAIACDASALGLERGFDLPATVSGTSASAALVSAAAAHLIGTVPLGPGGNGWSAAELSRLLYLSGARLCSGTGVDERRISVQRAVTALTSSTAACHQLRSCVRTVSPTRPPVGPMTGLECDAHVIACLGYAPKPCEIGDEPSWSSSAIASAAAAPSLCRYAWDAAWAPPPPPPLHRLAQVPGLNLGSLGPQPANTGCPNCAIVIPGPDKFWFRYEIGDEFKAGTYFSDMRIVLFNRDHRVRDVIIPVGAGDGREWLPGEVGRLQLPEEFTSGTRGEALARALFAGTLMPVLDMAIHTPDGDAARNDSALAVSRD